MYVQAVGLMIRVPLLIIFLLGMDLYLPIKAQTYLTRKELLEKVDRRVKESKVLWKKLLRRRKEQQKRLVMPSINYFLGFVGMDSVDTKVLNILPLHLCSIFSLVCYISVPECFKL